MAERLAVPRRAGDSRARAAPGSAPAGLGVRILAYAVDSVVLFAFASAVSAVAFLNILLHSDAGRVTASDRAIWSSAVVLLATVPAWGLLNLLLTARRGQTVGQYMFGLRLQREEGGEPGLARLLLYWLALHPLLYHPMLAGFWVLLAYVSIALSHAMAVAVACTAIGLLSLLAPLASLVMAAGDPERRGIHDRIAGMTVTRVE